MGYDHQVLMDTVTADSRTAVQLPTDAIWNNFNLAGLRAGTYFGSVLDVDFRRPNEGPDYTFVDATYAASAAGKTPTEHLYPGTGASGELLFFATTDNQAVEAQWQCPITTTGTSVIWAMEFRIKQVNITDSKAGWFAGLFVPSKLAGDQIADAGTLADGGAIGFQKKEADGDILDLVYDKASQTQNEHDDDWATLAANTYVTAGLYYNGTTIQPYLNGVKSGSVISATDIAATDFPSATVMLPSVFLKNAAADDFTVTLDWMRAAYQTV